MNALDKLTQILGWCTVISFSLLMMWFLWILAFGEFTFSMYTMMFGLAEAEARLLFVTLMVQFEILVLVFNFIPYIALKIVNRTTQP